MVICEKGESGSRSRARRWVSIKGSTYRAGLRKQLLLGESAQMRRPHRRGRVELLHQLSHDALLILQRLREGAARRVGAEQRVGAGHWWVMGGGGCWAVVGAGRWWVPGGGGG
eukprot:2785533-Pleurochrysis_carterae.AAC.1